MLCDIACVMWIIIRLDVFRMGWDRVGWCTLAHSFIRYCTPPLIYTIIYTLIYTIIYWYTVSI